MLLGSLAALAAAKQADLILCCGKVLTADPAFTVQSAVAVKEGKIIAVGGAEIARQYTASQVIDLKGRVLMPGFMDTHVHLIPSGKRDIDLREINSIAQLQDAIRHKAQELGPGAWITGSGWDEARFAERRNPVRGDSRHCQGRRPSGGAVGRCPDGHGQRRQRRGR